MNVPPYFRQESPSTCSLAALRMALNHFGILVSESELKEKVKSDYGEKFSNIWNPTVAKLACEYGLETRLYAEWPLFKEGVLQQAHEDYKTNPANFDVAKYENTNDSDELPEPLPLSYKEMFLAIEKGCKTEYSSLTESKLSELIESGYLIQTSIKLHLMYSQSKIGFHSILIYRLDEANVSYHDPHRGAAMSCTKEHLLKATMDVGAFIAYRK